MEKHSNKTVKYIKPIQKGDETRTFLHSWFGNQVINQVNKLTYLINTMRGINGVYVKSSDSNVIISGKPIPQNEDVPQPGGKGGTTINQETNNLVNCMCRYS